jgi:hypothetical protein
MSCCDDDNFDPPPEGVTIQDEGISLPGVFDTLNFIGGDITATDAGGGIANITVSTTKQVFRYTATGAEPNPFTVTLPAARASANYNVQIMLLRALANAIKIVSVVSGTLTINDFDVELSAAIELGDILMITVEDFT